MTKGEITEPSKDGIVHRVLQLMAERGTQTWATNPGGGGGGEGEVVVVDDFFRYPAY